MSERKGLVYDLPEAEYHAGGANELSSTGAKLILESAAKFKHEVVDGNHVHRSAYDLGTAVHTKVLGTGVEPVSCPPELLASNGAMSTKAAKEWKAEQQAADIPILTASEIEQADAMAEAVLSYLPSRMLFEREGRSEVSVFDELDGVKRRSRFDYMPNEGGVVVDLKTTLDASPAGFPRAAAKYGYHIQRGHYLDILARATGRKADMMFVTVEKTAPYLVAVHRLDDEFASMGEVEALEAVNIYRRCMESGVWPGYPEEINIMKPPVYSIYDYQDRYESEEIRL